MVHPRKKAEQILAGGPEIIGWHKKLSRPFHLTRAICPGNESVNNAAMRKHGRNQVNSVVLDGKFYFSFM
jgi:hypothetical protein